MKNNDCNSIDLKRYIEEELNESEAALVEEH